MNIIDFLKNKFKNKNSQPIEKQLFQEYNDIKPREHSEILEGHRGKEFIRVDADFFVDLIEEIKNNPNSSYVTYVDELIKNSDITPSYISVLKKEFEEDDKFNFIDNEVISSRVANAMGVPTVYNAKYDNKLLSIDFLKFGSKIINIEDKLQDFSETLDLIMDDSPFVNQILQMEQIVDFHNMISKQNKWKFNASEFRKEYLLHYLTRNFIIGDSDAYPRNVCFVVDRDNNLCLGPMFDTEQSFSNIHLLQSNVYDLIYAMKYMPETFKEFDNKFKQLFEKETFNSLFKGCKKTVARARMDYIKNNYSHYISECERAKRKLELNYERY